MKDTKTTGYRTATGLLWRCIEGPWAPSLVRERLTGAVLGSICTIGVQHGRIFYLPLEGHPDSNDQNFLHIPVVFCRTACSSLCGHAYRNHPVTRVLQPEVPLCHKVGAAGVLGWPETHKLYVVPARVPVTEGAYIAVV